MGNIIELIFNEDLIKLIKLLRVQKLSDYVVGLDNYDLYPISPPLDFIALEFGLQDHKLPSTEENPMGASYDEETEKYLVETHCFIVDNLEYIEEILHQFCDVGIKPGKYTCLAQQRIWKYQLIGI